MQDKTNSIYGIDISHYNDVDDWQAVKDSGVNFVYCKATQGTNLVDSKFASFVKGAKEAGIPIGAYHFADLGDPVDEANHFLSVIDQYDLDLLPVLDLEKSTKDTDLEQWARTFISTVNQKVMLYTGNWYIDQYSINGLSEIPLWTSYYKNTPPYDCGGWTEWTIWQYSETGSVEGITGDVDLDVAVSLDSILIKGEEKQMNTTEKVIVNVKGKEIQGFIINGVSFIGTREIVEALGLTISYDDKNKVVVVK
ncbi:MAG TPA: GH25 family lysozyme [Bacillota bacterium]|nr:GH25 family lysozyme [Bacillota bacterium]